jgi:hypothetical protein
MLRVRLAVSLVIVAALAITATPALASVADEQQAGRALAQQVQSGKRPCDSLSAEDLDHIGEFVMGRMIGSTAAHEAMNARVTAVMGASAESRMHQVLGARFVGCTTNAGSGANAYGPMMGNDSGSWSQGDWSTMMGNGGWGSMMRSGAWAQMMGNAGDWSWMTGSRWQHMTASDWQAVQRRLLGTTTTRNTDGNGVSTLDVVLIALAAALAAGLLGLLLARRPRRGAHA